MQLARLVLGILLVLLNLFMAYTAVVQRSWFRVVWHLAVAALLVYITAR